MVQTSTLREWLTTYFNLDSLGIFCHDYFPDFYKTEFNPNQTILHNSQRLIAYCEQQGLLGFLFGCIMKERSDAIPIEELMQRGKKPTHHNHPPNAQTEDPPGVRVHTCINPLFPITIVEWRNEFVQRNQHFGRPDSYWCYVRPGDYAIGGWEPKAVVDTLSLDEFWIAKYPITVQQYRVFIQKGGYNQEQYWTPKGWAWRKDKNRTEPWRWGEKRFSGNNQPVIGVTWYEAMAFVKWLTSELALVLPQGSSICLPTEAEWEAAAAYDTKGHRRPYPWGDDNPTRDLADFDDGSNPHSLSLVGERLMGAAACGSQDMLGSVWEPMCTSYVGYPMKSKQVVADFALDSGDVPYRGGAWRNVLSIIRCAARLRSFPGSSYNVGGFRVVLHG